MPCISATCNKMYKKKKKDGEVYRVKYFPFTPWKEKKKNHKAVTETEIYVSRQPAFTNQTKITWQPNPASNKQDIFNEGTIPYKCTCILTSVL